MTTPIHTGGCQCGAVRFSVEGELGDASVCHCRMCQKAFGSYFAPLAGVSREAFEVTRGSIATFRSSDFAERGFCAACGTPLTFRYLTSKRIAISLGSLDLGFKLMRDRPDGFVKALLLNEVDS